MSGRTRSELTLGLLPILYLAHPVVTPIRELERVVASVEAGDLSPRAPLLGADEISASPEASTAWLADWVSSRTNCTSNRMRCVPLAPGGSPPQTPSAGVWSQTSTTGRSVARGLGREGPGG